MDTELFIEEDFKKILPELRETEMREVVEEEVLQKTFSLLKNAQLQTGEKEAELKKAQHHLAKKVKENTILQDQLERQKIEIDTLKKELEQMRNEIKENLYQMIESLNLSQK